MATVPKPRLKPTAPPELHSGDRMSREEFHRIYEQMPDNFKAELIGGIVYVASPLGLPHGHFHLHVGTLLGTFEAYTPGVYGADNATVILDEDAEPQPDLFLRILPEFGGQSRETSKKYLAGAPELIVEIAHSSKAIDLHVKRNDYTRTGVIEYLVLCVEELRLRWFDLPADQELQADADDIIRARTFPGLWFDVEAILACDGRRSLETLQKGLATPEHQAFVAQLESARKSRKKRKKSK